MNIFVEDYDRFLKQEIQLIKFKESCQKKSAELKRLHDQLAYFKKQVLILRNKQNSDQNCENRPKKPTFANVMI